MAPGARQRVYRTSPRTAAQFGGVKREGRISRNTLVNILFYTLSLNMTEEHPSVLLSSTKFFPRSMAQLGNFVLEQELEQDFEIATNKTGIPEESLREIFWQLLLSRKGHLSQKCLIKKTKIKIKISLNKLTTINKVIDKRKQ